MRARYWNDGLKIGRDHPLVGVGAGGYPTARTFYRQDTLEVQHAHGYVIQTFADLGVVGLVLSLAFCAAWARRRDRHRRRAPRGDDTRADRPADDDLVRDRLHLPLPDRLDLLHSRRRADCAAPRRLGRRPRAARPPGRAAPERRERIRMAGLTQRPVRAAGRRGRARPGALLRLVGMAAAAFAAGRGTAFAALAAKNYPAARAAADTAAARDPLSVEPLLDLATVETAAGGPQPHAPRSSAPCT